MLTSFGMRVVYGLSSQRMENLYPQSLSVWTSMDLSAKSIRLGSFSIHGRTAGFLTGITCKLNFYFPSCFRKNDHIIIKCPVKNVTGIFSCLLDGSLVENEIKSAREIPLFFSQMPCKFHDLNLSKTHIMSQHGRQIKPG